MRPTINTIDETIAIDWQITNQSQQEIVINQSVATGNLTNRVAIDWINIPRPKPTNSDLL